MLLYWSVGENAKSVKIRFKVFDYTALLKCWAKIPNRLGLGKRVV